jgi:hypothetical protein
MMEYLINSKGPFQEIEARAVEALQQAGFLVQPTFRLLPSVSDVDDEGRTRSRSHEANRGDPGYTVLMLYRSGLVQSPLGLVTLYGRGGQTVLRSQLEPFGADEVGHPGKVQDVEAELAAALSQGDLDFCVHGAGDSECIDVASLKEMEQ